MLLTHVSLEIADALWTTIEITALTATKLAVLGRAFVPDGVGLIFFSHVIAFLCDDPGPPRLD